jgi:hypothetical protein
MKILANFEFSVVVWTFPHVPTRTWSIISKDGGNIIIGSSYPSTFFFDHRFFVVYEPIREIFQELLEGHQPQRW